MTTLPYDKAQNKVRPKIHTCDFLTVPSLTVSSVLHECVNPKYPTGVSFPQPNQCIRAKF